MHLDFFLKGLLIGFSIAAPVGPIGLLCIQRTLSRGRLHGLFTGLGAASADAVYGCIAGFGLTAVSGLLLDNRETVRLIGGFFLCWLGSRTFFARPPEREVEASGNGLMSSWISTFFLTLANPMTILSFVAVFAGLGITGAGGDWLAALSLVSGVFFGSAFWWLILSEGVGLAGKRMNRGALIVVNRISGVIIMAFGILAVVGK